MSRAHNRSIMGYYALDEIHYHPILSLIAPTTSTVRFLDPTAGEGAFAAAVGQRLKVTVYTNELDEARAQACIERFGPLQAVRGDIERLRASLHSFGLIWLNPPYENDPTARHTKRVEFRHLKEAWRWAQHDGLVMWCIYQHHLSDEAMTFLAKNTSQVDIWQLPGQHLGEYTQIVVAAVVSPPHEISDPLYSRMAAQRADPPLLTVQPEPRYRLPAANPKRRFVFAPDIISPDMGLSLTNNSGAWHKTEFQRLLQIPDLSLADIESIVPPRPGHMALVLAGGTADGALITTQEGETVAIRTRISREGEVARVETVDNPKSPDHPITRTTIRMRPKAVVTLVNQQGHRTELSGDEAIISFISANRDTLIQYVNQRVKPIYNFDLAGLGAYLKGLKVKGRYPLYLPQQHVVAAVHAGFRHKKGILLCGQMGVGKTSLGGAVALALARNSAAAEQGCMRPDQVILVVAPPHLANKWERELLGLANNTFVRQLKNVSEVKTFMDRAAHMRLNVPKVGIIKRDLVKLSAATECGAMKRKIHTIEQYLDTESNQLRREIRSIDVLACPTCGATAMMSKGGASTYASADYLRQGRHCDSCNAPLYQQGRGRGKRETRVSRNPQYALAEYIKRFYKDRVYLLIWDEVHESQSNSTGNGLSFGVLAGIARKVLAMTGTPFNGKASSLMNLEYHLNPRVRQRYNWGPGGIHKGEALRRWSEDMGVMEQYLEEYPDFDPHTGVCTGATTYERPFVEAAGISPLLVAEMLDHTVYFSRAPVRAFVSVAA